MLTMLQIIQMFWGMFINVIGYYCTKCSRSMQRYNFKPQIFCSDVPQLLYFVIYFKQTYSRNKNVNKVGKKNQIKTE